MQICTLDVVFQPFCGKPEVLKVHMHLMSLYIYNGSFDFIH